MVVSPSKVMPAMPCAPAMAKRTDPMKPRLIDTQNRIILPEEALQRLKAKAGDYLAVVVDTAGVHLRKVDWVVREH